jgi:type VI protein secretion system component VasK
MAQLILQTRRIRRGWLHRLKGLDRLYETRVTDGYRCVTAKASTPDAAERAAERMWVTKFGRADETTERHLASPAPSIVLDEASPAKSDEVIGARRTELAEVAEALRAELDEIADGLRTRLRT